MSAYDSIRLDDYTHRQDKLTATERATFYRLCRQAEKEELEAEQLPHHFMLGGDYPDP